MFLTFSVLGWDHLLHLPTVPHARLGPAVIIGQASLKLLVPYATRAKQNEECWAEAVGQKMEAVAGVSSKL